MREFEPRPFSRAVYTYVQFLSRAALFFEYCRSMMEQYASFSCYSRASIKLTQLFFADYTRRVQANIESNHCLSFGSKPSSQHCSCMASKDMELTLSTPVELPDLGFLTDQERASILMVVKADEKLKKISLT